MKIGSLCLYALRDDRAGDGVGFRVARFEFAARNEGAGSHTAARRPRRESNVNFSAAVSLFVYLLSASRSLLSTRGAFLSPRRLEIR